MPLMDLRMHDGSRQFAALPETYDVQHPQWWALRDRIEQLPGAKLQNLVTDNVTEAWIDFTYRGHELSLNNQFGEWWFFVKDPACPDELLREVIAHFEPMLRPS